MQKRNYGQAKRQKEMARKVRQQQKQERRRGSTPEDKPAGENAPALPDGGTSS